MKKNQNGFSLVEGLLIILVIAVVGFIGWSVANSKKAVDSQKTPNVSSEKTNKLSPESSDAVTYTVIKEWGVKVPQLPTGNLISYEISAATKNKASFVSSEQKALGGNCGELSYAKYQIYQEENGYKSSDDVLQNKLNAAAQNNLAIKADDKTYYIISDMSGGDCTGKLKEGESTSQQEIAANQNLVNSLAKLQAN